MVSDLTTVTEGVYPPFWSEYGGTTDGQTVMDGVAPPCWRVYGGTTEGSTVIDGATWRRPPEEGGTGSCRTPSKVVTDGGGGRSSAPGSMARVPSGLTRGWRGGSPPLPPLPL